MKHKEWLPGLQLKLSEGIGSHDDKSHMDKAHMEINTMLSLSSSPYASTKTNAI